MSSVAPGSNVPHPPSLLPTTRAFRGAAGAMFGGIEYGVVPAARKAIPLEELKKKKPPSALPLSEVIIRLDGRELASVPPEATKFKGLKTLSLERNKLTQARALRGGAGRGCRGGGV